MECPPALTSSRAVAIAAASYARRPASPARPPRRWGGSGLRGPPSRRWLRHVAVRRTAPAPQLHAPAPTGAALCCPHRCPHIYVLPRALPKPRTVLCVRRARQ
jgi:hypothetical protein